MNSYSDVDGVPAGADPWLLTEVLRDEWGFDRHGRLRLLGGAVPGHHAPGRGRHRRGRRAGARGRHRRRAARHARLRRRAGRAGAPRRAAGGARRPRRPAAAARRRSQLGLLDPDWTPEALGRRRRRRRPRLAGQPGAGPRDGRALGRPARRRHGAAAARRRTGRRCAGWPSSGRAPPTRARSWAATRSPTTCCRATPGSGLGIEVPTRGRRAAGRAARRRGRPRAGLRRAGRRPVRLRRRGRRRPRRRPVRRLRRRPRRAVRPRHLGRGLRRRGPAAARACRPTWSTQLLDDRHAGRRRRRLRPPVRARRRRTAGPPAWSRRSCPARRAASAIAGVLSGRVAARRQAAGADPAARRAASRAPTCSRRSAAPRAPASATLDPTPLFPFGYGASYTTFEVDDLRISATEVPTDGEFTVVRAGPQHRRARRRRGRPALPARRGRPGGPAGASS